MSEELAAEVPAEPTPTDVPADTPTEPAPDPNAEVFEQMIPLFKQLNYGEDQARDVLAKVSSGMDFTGLTNEENLVFGKYKDITAAQDAFKTLESENGRLRREKSPEAPEEYSYDFAGSDEMKEIMPEDFNLQEDHLMQAMDPIFKNNNVSQDQMQGIIKGWLEYEQSLLPVPEEEEAKLGANAPQIISDVETFVKKNFTAEEQAMLEGVATTGEATLLLHKIAKLVNGSKQMPTDKAQTHSGESSAALYNKAFKLKKETGSNFQFNTTAQAAYEELMEKAIAAEEAGF